MLQIMKTSVRILINKTQDKLEGAKWKRAGWERGKKTARWDRERGKNDIIEGERESDQDEREKRKESKMRKRRKGNRAR